MEKNQHWIRIGNYIIECDDPTMSLQDWNDWIDDLIMEQMVESMSGRLLLKLYRYFDSETRPLRPSTFCDFWERLDPYEQLDWLLFADNLVTAKEN